MQPAITDPVLNNYNNPPVANAPVRTVVEVSDYPVMAEDNTNQVPVFADDEEDTEDTNEQAREVDENDKNALVGAPVRARDSDVLHYSLDDVMGFLNDVTDTALDPTPGKFKIDNATGQISVNGSLSHEAAAIYTVVVTAKDPFNADDTVTVEITVNDVNDAPKFDADTGNTKLYVVENTRDTTAGSEAGAPFVTPTRDDDGNITETPDATDSEFTYTATDEDHYDGDGDGTTGTNPDERESVEYDLAGPDKKLFSISDEGVLSFKATTKVNFEKQDSYSVTIVARDQRKLTKTEDVTVRVIDAEDGGRIEFSTRQPQAGHPITAEVVDDDGVKGSITWLWSKAPADTDNAGNVSCSIALVPIQNYDAVDDDADEDRDEKATFTPEAGDVLANGDFAAFCLRVTASYNDGYVTVSGAENDDDAAGEAASPVLPLRRSNDRPVFKVDDEIITSATREVVEDGDEDRTSSQMNVGSAVEAEDPDDDRTKGPDDTDIELLDNLTYSLRGEDAASFKIEAESGQIMVKAELDYETKSTYRVTVRATDGSRAYRDLPVTISITNVNEKPVVSGDATVSFKENGTGSVATYTAVDPEGDAFTWSLKPNNSDDIGKFKIDPEHRCSLLQEPTQLRSCGGP